MPEASDVVSDEIKKLLQGIASSSSKPPSIFRVQDYLRHENDKQLYEPKVVSIGPFHHGKENLKIKEKDKPRYLKRILEEIYKSENDSSEDESSIVDRYVKEIRSLQQSARECYSENDFNEDEFVKILLLDSFFIIQLLRDYISDDQLPVSDATTIFQLRHDMMLVENQIPFVVLNKLFSMTKNGQEDNIVQLVKLFMNNCSPWPNASSGKPIEIKDVDDHLLGLVYRIWCSSFDATHSPDMSPRTTELPEEIGPVELPEEIGPVELPEEIGPVELLDGILIYRTTALDILPMTGASMSFTNKSSTYEEELNMVAINPTTELQEAGVKFQKKLTEEENSSLKIQFIKGVLKIPCFNVSDETESILRNLIVYEHFMVRNPSKYITDNEYFLHCLINSSKDVEILRCQGILNNFLGDDEMVYLMFNRLVRDIRISARDFYYAKVFKEVKEHCRHRRNRWMVILKRDYFNSPWAYIAFLAAVMLLLFTLAQTVFSALSYFKQ